ncbi:unnamed protein product [Closterium sp. NIES-65]|nr:unnamed protein product [Closterium sp. NIES-65]
MQYSRRQLQFLPFPPFPTAPAPPPVRQPPPGTTVSSTNITAQLSFNASATTTTNSPNPVAVTTPTPGGVTAISPNTTGGPAATGAGPHGSLFPPVFPNPVTTAGGALLGAVGGPTTGALAGAAAGAAAASGEGNATGAGGAGQGAGVTGSGTTMVAVPSPAVLQQPPPLILPPAQQQQLTPPLPPAQQGAGTAGGGFPGFSAAPAGNFAAGAVLGSALGAAAGTAAAAAGSAVASAAQSAAPTPPQIPPPQQQQVQSPAPSAAAVTPGGIVNETLNATNVRRLKVGYQHVRRSTSSSTLRDPRRHRICERAMRADFSAPVLPLPGPEQQCDFFFLYNRARPPVFRLSPQQVNRLLSPPVYHRSGVKVISANSNGNMSCNGPQCSPIFYFTSPTVGPSGGGRFPMAANCLAHHPIPTYVYQEYRLKCILLYMDNLVLPRVGWLNPNDNKQEKFPEPSLSRRATSASLLQLSSLRALPFTSMGGFTAVAFRAARNSTRRTSQSLSRQLSGYCNNSTTIGEAQFAHVKDLRPSPQPFATALRHLHTARPSSAPVDASVPLSASAAPSSASASSSAPSAAEFRTGVQRNGNIAKLQAGYLFPEVARRKAAHIARTPSASARMISLGIGDTTEPIPAVIAQAMADRAAGLGTLEGYTGYAGSQGEEVSQTRGCCALRIMPFVMAALYVSGQCRFLCRFLPLWLFSPHPSSPLVQALRRGIVAAFYEGMGVAHDDVFVSDGAKCDIARLQMMFGANVSMACQDPSYPAYVDTSVIMGQTGAYDPSSQHYGNITYLRCSPENDFFPRLASAPRTDIIFFCSPNNPTGKAASRAQLEELVGFARRNGSIVVYDSAYGIYIEDDSPRSIYEIEGAHEVAIKTHLFPIHGLRRGARVELTCSYSTPLFQRFFPCPSATPNPTQVAIETASFSKYAGFTGVRLGWTVVPSTLRYANGHAVRADFSRIANTAFNGASNIAQAGGTACVSSQGLQAMRGLIAFYKENARILKTAFSEAGLETYGGVNAPYVWVRFPGRSSWEVFEEILARTDMVTTPGSGFGPGGESFIRVSAFGHRENIVEAARRMVDLYGKS